MCSQFPPDSRQIRAAAGNAFIGLGTLLPKFEVEKDYEAMTVGKYRLKAKTAFRQGHIYRGGRDASSRGTAVAICRFSTRNICQKKCTPKFIAPCITFCPAGVYETVQGEVKPQIRRTACTARPASGNARLTISAGRSPKAPAAQDTRECEKPEDRRQRTEGSIADLVCIAHPVCF